MIRITIDGKEIEVEPNITILEAAKSVNIRIPTLCYNKYLHPYGGCRICVVEATGGSLGKRVKLVSSCSYPVEEGLIIKTNTQRIIEARKFIVELFLARCIKTEILEKLANDYGIDTENPHALDPVGRYLLSRAKGNKNTKCILCGLCVRVCEEVVQRSALSFAYRGTNRKVVTPYNKISETCIGCGSCAYLCPTGAITVEEAE